MNGKRAQFSYYKKQANPLFEDHPKIIYKVIASHFKGRYYSGHLIVQRKLCVYINGMQE
jgi:hypothetical protein